MPDILTYKFGARKRFPGDKYPTLQEQDMEQLFLAWRLRNDLVSVERALDEAIETIYRTDPKVNEIFAADPIDWKALKEARALAYPMVRDQLKEAYSRRDWLVMGNKQAGVTGLRQYYANLGLYWGTYNDVIAQHETAVRSLWKSRKLGAKAQFRYHRWDGTGRLTVQIQDNDKRERRSPERLREAPWYSDTLQLGDGVVSIRTVTTKNGEKRDIPVKDRPLPEDSEITMARLVRRRIGSDYRLSVNLTFNTEFPPPRSNGPTVAMHVGWRVRPDGSLRVATICATEEIIIPNKLKDVMISYGNWAEIIVPSKWRGDYEYYHKLQSGRDKDLNRILQLVKVETGVNTNQWTSNTLSKRVINWRDDPNNRPDYISDELMTRLEAWRKQDKHLWNWHEHGLERVRNRRNYYWQNVVAFLAKWVCYFIVDNVNLADLKRVPKLSGDDSMQAKYARANMYVASPGKLREYALNNSRKHGCTTVSVDTFNYTNTHYECGYVNPRDERFVQSAKVWCDGCGHQYDQDRNVGLMVLASRGEIPPNQR